MRYKIKDGKIVTNHIYVKVNTKKGIITVKRGFFGAKSIYGNRWYENYSIKDIIDNYNGVWR